MVVSCHDKLKGANNEFLSENHKNHAKMAKKWVKFWSVMVYLSCFYLFDAIKILQGGYYWALAYPCQI